MQTATNLTKSNTNNMANVLDYTFSQKLFNLNTCMICIFSSYITINNIKYGIVQQLINNLDVTKKSLQSAIQFNVPINYIMGGNAGINIEYQAGDLVLVVYSQQSLTDLKVSWESNNHPTNGINPTNYGKFTLEDGIIIGKVATEVPQVIINITPAGITLNSNNTPIVINSGNGNTTVTCNNAIINASNSAQITASSEIDLTAPSIKLNGAVSCDSTLNATTSITAPLITGGTTSISSAGIASSAGDLAINGSPFRGHIHGNGNAGQNTTGVV